MLIKSLAARRTHPLHNWFFATFVLLLAMALPVQSAERDKVAAFLKVTGFNVAIESIALSARTAPEMLGFEAGEFGNQWMLLTESVFDPDYMRERATDILEATLDDNLLTHAAGFYASELGQRLVAAENRAYMADDVEKNAQGARLLAELQDKGDPRIDLFTRMGKAVDPNDIALQAMTEIQVRFILAASYAGVITLRVDEQGLRAALAENAEEVAAAVEISSLENAAYTYRDFSLEDLETYTDALEEPDMMTVYELMNAVHFEVMSNRFEALALRLGQLQPAQEL